MFQDWWNNFVYAHFGVSYITIEKVNKYLKPYKAKMYLNLFVEFETERDYVFFLLKWS